MPLFWPMNRLVVNSIILKFNNMFFRKILVCSIIILILLFVLLKTNGNKDHSEFVALAIKEGYTHKMNLLYENLIGKTIPTFPDFFTEKTHQYLFIFYYSDDCRPCIKLGLEICNKFEMSTKNKINIITTSDHLIFQSYTHLDTNYSFQKRFPEIFSPIIIIANNNLIIKDLILIDSKLVNVENDALILLKRYNSSSIIKELSN